MGSSLRATRLPVPIWLTNECPWIGPPDADGFTPFGPDSRLDNIYQSLPQVTLHGMDEGLTLKLVDGVLNTIIAEAVQLRGMNITSVRVWQVLVSKSPSLLNTNDILCLEKYIHLIISPVRMSSLTNLSFNHIMFGNKCERQHTSYLYTLPT